MKKPPENSALTVYSNVIHTNVNIYFRIYDEQKYFMMGFALDFVIWEPSRNFVVKMLK